MKTIKQPNIITRTEFRADPAAALRRAEKEGALTIVDENEKPCITISGQSEIRSFEGEVIEYDHNLELVIAGEEIICGDDLFEGLVGKRVRVIVEVLS